MLKPPLNTNSAIICFQLVLSLVILEQVYQADSKSPPLSSALIALLNDQYSFVLSALVAGLIADLLVWRFNPARTPPAALRMFALVVPIVFYSLYFPILSVTKGNGLSIHLWMGSIVQAGITSLLPSYLLVPPLAGVKETKADVTNEE